MITVGISLTISSILRKTSVTARTRIKEPLEQVADILRSLASITGFDICVTPEEMVSLIRSHRVEPFRFVLKTFETPAEAVLFKLKHSDEYLIEEVNREHSRSSW